MEKAGNGNVIRLDRRQAYRLARLGQPCLSRPAGSHGALSELPLPGPGGTLDFPAPRTAEFYAGTDKAMSHLEFADGSNAMVLRLPPLETARALAGWERSFRVEFLRRSGGITYYRLTEKRKEEPRWP